MKVLHVIPSVSMVHGGPSRAIRSIGRALAASGEAEVTLATTDDDGPRRRSADLVGLMVGQRGNRAIFFRKRADFYTFAPGMVPWLWRHVRDFDVCHVHALFSFPSTAASVIALLRGVPLVVRPLGTLDSYGVKHRRPLLKRASLIVIERPVLRRAAAVHCTSTHEQREVLAIEPLARTVVVPLAVETLEPAIGDLTNTPFPEYAGKRIVLFLSRLDPKKNIEVLLEAWAFRTPDTNDHLVIAGRGDGKYVQSLVARAVQLGIADRVSWHGYADDAAKSLLFGLASVFVLPSRSENFGIAVAEALAAGVPCVVTPGVALANAIADADAGTVVEASPAKIADAVSKYLCDDQFRHRQSKNARSLASREFTTAIMATRLLELYAAVGRKSDKSNFS